MNRKLAREKNIFDTLSWLTIALFSVLYLTLIKSTNVWTDEAFTLQLLKNGIVGIIKGTANDVHPPLYYLYAKIFFVIFNGSLMWQKIATIIPMVALLIWAEYVVKREFGSVVAFLFILFITCIPCTMEFTVQVRMYSLALLLVTLCGFYAFKAFDDGAVRYFAICGLTGLGAAYTHYFAFVPVVVIYGFLLVVIVWKAKEVFVKWIVTGACMIVGYLPWVPFFYKQVTRVESNYWIPEITPITIWNYFTWTFDLKIVNGVFVLFVIILKALSVVNQRRIDKTDDKQSIYALFCMLVPACTCGLGVAASYAKTPIYRDQYILPSLGLLAMFFAISLGKSKKIFVAACSAFLLIVGLCQYKESYEQEYTSTLWPQTKAFFDENLGENDYILYNYELFGFIYECHFDEDKLCYFQDFDFASEYDTLWLLDTEGATDIDESIIIDNGLTLERMGHYGIEHNEFDIYKVSFSD